MGISVSVPLPALQHTQGPCFPPSHHPHHVHHHHKGMINSLAGRIGGNGGKRPPINNGGRVGEAPFSFSLFVRRALGLALHEALSPTRHTAPCTAHPRSPTHPPTHRHLVPPNPSALCPAFPPPPHPPTHFITEREREGFQAAHQQASKHPRLSLPELATPPHTRPHKGMAAAAAPGDSIPISDKTSKEVRR